MKSFVMLLALVVLNLSNANAAENPIGLFPEDIVLQGTALKVRFSAPPTVEQLLATRQLVSRCSGAQEVSLTFVCEKEKVTFELPLETAKDWPYQKIQKVTSTSTEGVERVGMVVTTQFPNQLSVFKLERELKAYYGMVQGVVSTTDLDMRRRLGVLAGPRNLLAERNYTLPQFGGPNANARGYLGWRFREVLVRGSVRTPQYPLQVSRDRWLQFRKSSNHILVNESGPAENEDATTVILMFEDRDLEKGSEPDSEKTKLDPIIFIG